MTGLPALETSGAGFCLGCEVIASDTVEALLKSTTESPSSGVIRLLLLEIQRERRLREKLEAEVLRLRRSVE